MHNLIIFPFTVLLEVLPDKTSVSQAINTFNTLQVIIRTNSEGDAVYTGLASVC